MAKWKSQVQLIAISSIGNIVEKIIDKRIGNVIEFSPGQAGGIKGAATTDHGPFVPTASSLMSTAIAKKTKTISNLIWCGKTLWPGQCQEHSTRHVECRNQWQNLAHPERFKYKSHIRGENEIRHLTRNHTLQRRETRTRFLDMVYFSTQAPTVCLTYFCPALALKEISLAISS